MDSGYVAVSPAAYDTPALKKYGQDFPQALVARDQLPVSVAEFSTHDNQRVTKVLNDAVQAALPWVRAWSARVAHLESLHAHDAVARVAGSNLG